MSKNEVVIANVVDKYNNPISELVQLACQFSSNVRLVEGTRDVNAKSIMGIMALSPSEGMKVDVIAEGEDEDRALDAMTQFLLCK